MDIEKAKDILVNVIADEVIGTYCIEIQKEVDCGKNCENEDCYLIQAIDTVLSDLEKKDKVINKMAEVLYVEGYCKEIKCNKCDTDNFVDCIKQYFTKKVEDK